MQTTDLTFITSALRIEWCSLHKPGWEQMFQCPITEDGVMLMHILKSSTA